MKIGILGTGVVGQTLGTKLVSRGHSVCLGSRSASNETGSTWAESTGAGATHGTFADAAQYGEVLFNCTLGQVSLEALRTVPSADLAGKVLVDVSNALDFSKGMPPTLFVSNSDSLGEQIQREFPKAKVVKSLNTVAAPLMVDPGQLHDGEHAVFVCGNDAGAKKTVEAILREELGWKQIIDLGDISMARGTEGYLLLWTRLYGAFQSPMFNLRIVR